MRWQSRLEIYEALRSAGVEDTRAKSAAEKMDSALQSRVERELNSLATKAELKAELAILRAGLIKRMFIFWVGQFAAIVGVMTAILFAFFKP